LSWERQRMDFDPSQAIKVDEDEGSPLRNGVNLRVSFDTRHLQCRYSTSAKGKSNDQRKPSGYAMTRQIFPSKDDFANNARKRLQGQNAKDGKKIVPGIRRRMVWCACALASNFY
jgi:hypothetical protein